jgi:hypothetical protein
LSLASFIGYPIGVPYHQIIDSPERIYRVKHSSSYCENIIFKIEKNKVL